MKLLRNGAKLIILSYIAAFGFVSSVFLSAADEGLDTNVWNINQGIVILKNSPMDAKVSSDVRNMFGAGLGSGGERYRAVFADGLPLGYTHFVEWRTVNRVKIQTINLYAAGDGPFYLNEREFDSFVLKTKSPGSTTFDTIICALTPTHPYNLLNETTELLMTTNVESIVGKEFRAEFVQFNAGRGFDGPRIEELEAIGQYLPLEDLWSIDQQISIITNSPIDGDAGTDVRNMFGATYGYGGERGRTIFSDGAPAGFAHFVEWQTTNYIRLESILLYAEGDGAIYLNEREFNRFTLRAKSVGSTNFDLTLCTIQPTHPYQLISKTPFFGLLLKTNITPVVAREFRAEFEQFNAGREYDGPRIERLQGFGKPAIVDGIPDSWRQQYFGTTDSDDPRIPATADPDEDGANNYEEFLAGTNPMNSSSVPAVLPSLLTFSPNGGEFTNVIAVNINSSVSNALVQYRLEDPAHTNQVLSAGVYSEPVMLDAAANLTAALFVNGYAISREYSADFVRIYAIDDGIPNDWRQKYFGDGYRTDPRVMAGADPDGDGANNLAEFLAGTNPTNAQSVLKITQLRLVPVITWNSVSNKTYRLTRREDINVDKWIVVAPSIQATSDSTSFTDYQATNNRAFYWVDVVTP